MRAATSALKLGRAAVNLALGAALGLGLLEGILHANPRLLIRGMAAPAPLDAPLTVQEYAVRPSDADLFYWHSSLIQPVPEAQDTVEARVRFATDEFGFPNLAPAGGAADIVVLGRSFSLGAQAETPWPQQLAATTGQRVINLSQAAIGISAKRGYWRHFGAPHHPQWVVVEVLPSMDILGFGAPPRTLIEQLPFPLVQTLARASLPDGPALDAPPAIYPLPLDLGPRTVAAVFYSYYLAALTANAEAVAASTQWAEFQAAVLALRDEAAASGACMVLVYAPTKEEVLVALAAQPDQLAPTLRAGWTSWQLTPSGHLTQNAPPPSNAHVLQAGASGVRELVRSFAARTGLPLADATEAMQAATLRGDDPFMRYDSHWSATGHALVAESVAGALADRTCP